MLGYAGFFLPPANYIQ